MNLYFITPKGKLTVNLPYTVTVLVLIVTALVLLTGCDNPVETDYCFPVEEGRIEWGRSNSANEWVGIGVDDRTLAVPGQHVNIFDDAGNGYARPLITALDTDRIDGIIFLMFDPMPIPNRGLSTYEVVDCR